MGNSAFKVIDMLKWVQLGPDHIRRAWDAMLKEGKSASVVEHAHKRLQRALNEAVQLRLITSNPCQAVSAPRAKPRELNPPNSSEIQTLLELAKGTDYFEVLHTAFHTGLRRNEALALRWRDIDLLEGTISVARSVYWAKGGRSVYDPPKTAKGRRLVALTPSSILVLRNLRERQESEVALLGVVISDDSPIFRYRNGRPILPRVLTAYFKKLAGRAGLEGYRFHDTRHAHATMMLRQGVHPKIVQERLGHANIGTTLDIYSHVTPGLQQAAALRFEDGLNEAITPEPPKEPVLASIGTEIGTDG